MNPFFLVISLSAMLINPSYLKGDALNQSVYSMCMEVNEERKEYIFKEYDSYFRKYLESTFYSRGITNDIFSFDVDENSLREKGKCENKRNFTSNSTVKTQFSATCPWVYKIKRRIGIKYPALRREAHCLCDSCQNKMIENKTRIYKCRPILNSMTCLEKSNRCDHEGFYKWIPSIEMISVGCVCA